MHKNAALAGPRGAMGQQAKGGAFGPGRSQSAAPAAGRKAAVPPQSSTRTTTTLGVSQIRANGGGLGASRVGGIGGKPPISKPAGVGSALGVEAAGGVSAASSSSSSSSSSSFGIDSSMSIVLPNGTFLPRKAKTLGLPDTLGAAFEASKPPTKELEALLAGNCKAVLERKFAMKQPLMGSQRTALEQFVERTEVIRELCRQREAMLAAVNDKEEEWVGRYNEANQLKPRCEALTQERAALEARVAELEGQLADSKADAAAKAATIAGHEGTISGLKAQAEEDGRKMEDLAARIAQLEKELEEETDLRVGAEERYEEYQQKGGAEFAELQKELYEAKAQLQREREDHQTDNNGWQEAFDEKAHELQVANDQSVMDKRALEDAENELQQWKSTARQLEIDLQSAKKLLEAEKKIISETRADMDGSMARLRQEAEQFSSELTSLRGLLHEETRRATALNVEKDALATKEASVRIELEKARDDIRRWEAKAGELREEAQGLKTSLAEERAEVKRLTAELASTTASLERCTRDKEEADNKVAELQARLLDSEEKRAKVDGEAATLRGRVTSLEAVEADLKSRLSAAEDREATLNKELGALRESAGSSESSQLDRITTMSRQMEQAKQRLRDANAEVARLRAHEHTIARLKEEVFAGEMARRGLHNTLQELKGNIRVFVRVRPFLPGEAEAAAAAGEPLELMLDGTPKASITCAPDGKSLTIIPPAPKAGGKEALPGAALRAGRPTPFHFDSVFGPRCGQDDVFAEVQHLVQSALDGYNVCLFSYGQTGSGKTWTMQGGSEAGQEGLIPRSVAQILATARRMCESAGWTYSLEASFLEIYNEAIRDLLRVPKPGGAPEPASLPIVSAASSSSSSSGAGGYPAASSSKADEDGNTAVEVPGLTKVPVEDEGTVHALLARAARRRAVASTAMNEVSSRSHSVFTLYIKGTHPVKGVALSGTLNLVDLAGSERLDRSKAEGDRKKEAAAINKSLSCLADVFTALASKAKHVPFRNSKLTHLLQPCFKGDGKTLMLVNVSPTTASAFESLCSLRFAEQVSKVEMGEAKKKVAAIEDVPVPKPAAASSSSSTAGAALVRPSVSAASKPRAATAAAASSSSSSSSGGSSRPAAFKPLTVHGSSSHLLMMSPSRSGGDALASPPARKAAAAAAAAPPSASSARSSSRLNTSRGYDLEDNSAAAAAAAGGAGYEDDVTGGFDVSRTLHEEEEEGRGGAEVEDEDMDGEDAAAYDGEGGDSFDVDAGGDGGYDENNGDDDGEGEDDFGGGAMTELEGGCDMMMTGRLGGPTALVSSSSSCGGNKRLSGSKRPLEPAVASKPRATMAPSSSASAVARKAGAATSMAMTSGAVGGRPPVAGRATISASTAPSRSAGGLMAPTAASAAAAKKPRLAGGAAAAGPLGGAGFRR